MSAREQVARAMYETGVTTGYLESIEPDEELCGTDVTVDGPVDFGLLANAAIAAHRRSAEALGFLVQCDCGQRALVATQPSGDWVCPRCAEVAEPQPLTVVCRRWMSGDPVPTDDDDYPITKVVG